MQLIVSNVLPISVLTKLWILLYHIDYDSFFIVNNFIFMIRPFYSYLWRHVCAILLLAVHASYASTVLKWWNSINKQQVLVASLELDVAGGTKLGLNENNLSHKNNAKYNHVPTTKLFQLMWHTVKYVFVR